MATPTPNSVISALGSVLGYIGAEAATQAVFNTLLWPQRSYGRFCAARMLQLALLGPAGGPLYKASLQVLDTASKRGMFQGHQTGHMLGTAFFPEEDSTVFSRAEGTPESLRSEPSRTNLWQRVVARMPVPLFTVKPSRPDAESGGPPDLQFVRARFPVYHLALTVDELDRKPPDRSFWLKSI
ncbi:hypothetical protein M8818_002085 [Zalaria obscura]|uniref:Uncharacterized protein n=1 Tax=Zalaria obscura TaxID=2024903 RepID=A0ACC3SJV1_9PEZI